MSSKLVPIAVSSQLDVSGEERIHVAPYGTIIKPVFVPARALVMLTLGSNYPTTLYPYDGITPVTISPQPAAIAQGGSWSSTSLKMFAATLVDNGQSESLYMYLFSAGQMNRLSTTVFNHGGPAYNSAWSSNHFAYCRQGSPHVFVCSYLGTNFTEITTLPDSVATGRAISVDYSDDGSLLAVAITGSGSDRSLSVYSIAGSIYTRFFTKSPYTFGDGSDVKFSGNHLAYAETFDGLTVYRVDAGPSLVSVFQPGSGAYQCDWSADGRFLAVLADSAPALRIYERSGDTFTQVFTDTVTINGNNDLAFAGNDLYLAIGGSTPLDTTTDIHVYEYETWTRITAKEFAVTGDMSQYGLSTTLYSGT